MLAAGLQLVCFASTRTFLIVCDNFWHLVSIIVWCQDFGAPTPLHPPKKTTTTNFVWWSCQVKKRPPLRPLLWWNWTSKTTNIFLQKFFGQISETLTKIKIDSFHALALIWKCSFHPLRICLEYLDMDKIGARLIFSSDNGTLSTIPNQTLQIQTLNNWSPFNNFD